MVSVQYGLPGLLPLGTEGKYDGQQMKYVENRDLLWLHLALLHSHYALLHSGSGGDMGYIGD